MKKKHASQPGSGLGLYLVKKITEIHSGKVSVTDNSPQGTKFILTFNQSNQSSMTKVLRILLVEDEADLAELIKINLELDGYKVSVAVITGLSLFSDLKSESFDLDYYGYHDA